MPKLRCSAQECIHNNQECCCRGEINVAGDTAGTSEETCCSNFYEDQGGAARNAVNQEPIQNIDIKCEAENCTHNKNCKCHADYVDVSGYGANRQEETCCSSFYPE